MCMAMHIQVERRMLITSASPAQREAVRKRALNEEAGGMGQAGRDRSPRSWIWSQVGLASGSEGSCAQKQPGGEGEARDGNKALLAWAGPPRRTAGGIWGRDDASKIVTCLPLVLGEVS